MGEVYEPAADGQVAALQREVALLREGLVHRATIGQATGVLAGRLNLNTDVAWRSLIRMSSHTNVKLRDVARVLVAAHNGTVGAEDQALAEQIATVLPSMVEPGDGVHDGVPAGAGLDHEDL